MFFNELADLAGRIQEKFRFIWFFYYPLATFHHILNEIVRKPNTGAGLRGDNSVVENASGLSPKKSRHV